MLQTRDYKLFILIVHTLTVSSVLTAQSTNDILEKIKKSNLKAESLTPSLNKSSGETTANDPNTRFYPSLPLNDLNIPTYSSSFTPMQGFYPMNPTPQPQTYSPYQFQSYPNPYNPQLYSAPPYHGNHGHQDQRGILFPLPIGNYPPYFGTPASSTATPQQPPYPSNNPYAVQPQTVPAQYYPQQQQYPQPQQQYQNPIPIPSYYNSFPQNNNINSEGFDVGSLPQQVKVPGIIQVKFSEDGKGAEIYCEFPKYLIIIQGIFWHHKYDHDPFGSYFDTQNGFEMHGIQVQSIDKWSSKLLIKDISPHYYGTFRCISAAVLPADDANRFRNSHSGDFGARTNSLIPPIHEFQARESKSSSSEEILKATEDNNYVNKRSRKMRLPDAIRRRSRNLDTTTYDPFEAQESIGRMEFLDNGYLSDPNYLPHPYHEHDYPPIPPHIDDIDRGQNGRHIIFGSDQQSPGPAPPPPPSNFGGYSTQGPGSNEPFGLKVPFYKPSYTVYTVYQEIIIKPQTQRTDTDQIIRERDQYGFNNNYNYRDHGSRSSGSRSRANRFHRFL